MDWNAFIDGYCERIAPGLAGEPLNAISNLAFILAAAVVWPRVRGMPTGQVLSAILFVIGVGSGLFHTFATRWAELADVIPIALFILAYLYAVNRDGMGLRPLTAGLATLGFLPFAALTGPFFARLEWLGSSAGYGPVPLLILLYALLLIRRAPTYARDLAIGAGLLIVSLAFRTLDLPVCATLPMGTHFMWHLVNGIMLGWMILAWRRHVLAGAQATR